jgi:hypothetical protein
MTCQLQPPQSAQPQSQLQYPGYQQPLSDKSWQEDREGETLDQQEGNRPSTYYIRYENNNSTQWDGKELIVGADELEKYPPSHLIPGNRVVLEYLKKAGGIEEWNAVIVEKSKYNYYWYMEGIFF